MRYYREYNKALMEVSYMVVEAWEVKSMAGTCLLMVVKAHTRLAMRLEAKLIMIVVYAKVPYLVTVINKLIWMKTLQITQDSCSNSSERSNNNSKVL